MNDDVANFLLVGGWHAPEGFILCAALGSLSSGAYFFSLCSPCLPCLILSCLLFLSPCSVLVKPDRTLSALLFAVAQPRLSWLPVPVPNIP